MKQISSKDIANFRGQFERIVIEIGGEEFIIATDGTGIPPDIVVSIINNEPDNQKALQNLRKAKQDWSVSLF